MRRKNKIKKSSIVIVSALSIMLGSFAMASAQDYKFTLVRGAISTNGSTDEQVWKDKNSGYGRVDVTSSSAPGYSTSYGIYSYDTIISTRSDIKNKTGSYGYILYDSNAMGKDFWVNLRATNTSTNPAANYTTVEGTWSPTI